MVGYTVIASKSFARPRLSLIDVQPDEIHRGVMIAAVPAVASQEPVHNMLCVGPHIVNCRHGDNLRTRDYDLWGKSDPVEFRTLGARGRQQGQQQVTGSLI